MTERDQGSLLSSIPKDKHGQKPVPFHDADNN
jgi:hypothetical protein